MTESIYNRLAEIHPHQKCYQRAKALAYSWQYVQPCSQGCLIINREMESGIYDEGHQFDKLVTWDGEVHIFSPLE